MICTSFTRWFTYMRKSHPILAELMWRSCLFYFFSFDSWISGLTKSVFSFLFLVEDNWDLPKILLFLFYSLDKLQTETQKLKLKTKIFFVGVNKNSTTFLYTLNRGEKKTFFRRGKSILVLLFKWLIHYID